MYEMINVFSGLNFPSPTFPGRMQRWLHIFLSSTVLFYTGLWAVKLSFLVFFRRLGNKVRNQKVLWWTVLGVTVATYIVCLGCYPYQCQTRTVEYMMGTTDKILLLGEDRRC